MESISHPPKLNKYDREALDSTETHPNLLDGSRRFTYFITASIDSSYHPATFHVELIIPPHYPMNPPRVRFLTRIFHPTSTRTVELILTSVYAETLSYSAPQPQIGYGSLWGGSGRLT